MPQEVSIGWLKTPASPSVHLENKCFHGLHPNPEHPVCWDFPEMNDWLMTISCLIIKGLTLMCWRRWAEYSNVCCENVNLCLGIHQNQLHVLFQIICKCNYHIGRWQSFGQPETHFLVTFVYFFHFKSLYLGCLLDTYIIERSAFYCSVIGYILSMCFSKYLLLFRCGFLFFKWQQVLL